MLLHRDHVVLPYEAYPEVLIAFFLLVIRLSHHLLLKHLSDQIIVITFIAIIRDAAKIIIFVNEFLTPIRRSDTHWLYSSCGNDATLGGHLISGWEHLAFLLDLLNIFVDILKELRVFFGWFIGRKTEFSHLVFFFSFFFQDFVGLQFSYSQTWDMFTWNSKFSVFRSLEIKLSFFWLLIYNIGMLQVISYSISVTMHTSAVRITFSKRFSLTSYIIWRLQQLMINTFCVIDSTGPRFHWLTTVVMFSWLSFK